jgi:hypothetical protein
LIFNLEYPVDSLTDELKFSLFTEGGHNDDASF